MPVEVESGLAGHIVAEEAAHLFWAGHRTYHIPPEACQYRILIVLSDL